MAGFNPITEDHRRSRIADLELEVRSWTKAEPDLALTQICDRPADCGVSIKIGALRHQLNKWNLTFKKNPARQRARSGGRSTGSQGVAGSAARDGRRKTRIHQ
jgi:hypothetical protein